MLILFWSTNPPQQLTSMIHFPLIPPRAPGALSSLLHRQTHRQDIEQGLSGQGACCSCSEALALLVGICSILVDYTGYSGILRWNMLFLCLYITFKAFKVSTNALTFDGGPPADQAMCDLYSLDPINGCWTSLSNRTTGIAPIARYGHGFSAVEADIYVFGGCTSSGGAPTLHEC